MTGKELQQAVGGANRTPMGTMDERWIATSLKLPPEAYERVKALADADERTVAFMLRRLIDLGLEKHDEAGK